MSPENKPELVPLVILSRGEQVLRKEYPAGKLSVGTSEKAGLQVQAEGMPELHPLLAPGKSGLFVYVRQGMRGTLSKGEHSLSLESLIALDLLPSKNELYAISVDPGRRLSLRFGDHVLTVGYGPKPVAEVKPQIVRVPKRASRARLKLRPTFAFAQIYELEADQRFFWSSLAIIGILYIGMLTALNGMIKYVPEPDVLAAPPPRVVKLVLPELEEPEVEVEEKVEEEEKAEKEEEEKAEEEEPASVEERREQARAEAQKLGLIQMLSSQGGRVTQDIQGVMDSLSNVFAAGALTTDPNEGDATLDGLAAMGQGSGGIEGTIAGLKGIKRRKVAADKEKIDNPVVQGEAASDSRRSYAAINNVVRRYQSALRILYQRLLRTYPAAQGKITFEFTIRADGSVHSVKTKNSDFRKYPDFEQGLKSRIEKIKFEPIPKGDVTVEFPFLFNPT